MALDRTSSTDGTTYWVSDKQPLTDIENWRQVTRANFQKLLVAAADRFPAYDPAANEKQSHITILMHGFNNKGLDRGVLDTLGYTKGVAWPKAQ